MAVAQCSPAAIAISLLLSPQLDFFFFLMWLQIGEDLTVPLYYLLVVLQ